MTDVSDVPVKRVDLFERFLQANQVAIFIAVCVLGYYMQKTSELISAIQEDQQEHETITGHPGMMEISEQSQSLLLQISEQIQTTNNRFSAFAIDYEIGSLISERRDVRIEMMVLTEDDETQRERYLAQIKDIENQLSVARSARATYLLEATGNGPYRERGRQ